MMKKPTKAELCQKAGELRVTLDWYQQELYLFSEKLSKADAKSYKLEKTIQRLWVFILCAMVLEVITWMI